MCDVVCIIQDQNDVENLNYVSLSMLPQDYCNLQYHFEIRSQRLRSLILIKPDTECIIADERTIISS